MNNGTVILDQPSSAISGGLAIASGATAQIGNNDNNGALPAGALADNGTLAFSRSGNVTLATGIAGTGGLTQNGSSTLPLSANNGYSGPTTVLQGTLALGMAGAVASSAQVNVNNGTLDLSAVTGSASLTTVNALAVTNASLKIGVPYGQPAVNVNILTAGGTANTINISALPPFSSYPTPVVLIQSATPIIGNNFTLGSLPPASPAYAGSLSLSADQTTLYLNVNTGPEGTRPYVVWSGGDANLDTNWSDALNWLEPGAPVSADNVTFSDVDAQAGSALNSPGSGTLNGGYVNNYVDQNFTVSTLTYTNVNNDYQNTLIASGATLTVTNASTNAASIVAIGSSTTSFGTGATENVTIAGANGTLNVANTNASFYVGLGAGAAGSQQATLDLSALGTFNATVNALDVGAMPTSSLDVSGIAYLAQTNLITANGGAVNEGFNGTVTISLLVGETTSTTGAAPSALYLGQNNVLNVNSVGVGLSKNSGQILFNPALAGQNPTAVFRFSDGVSPVTAWSIGDGLGQTGASTAPTGTVDFTGGSVDALVSTIYIGRSPNATGGHPSTGTLNLGAGIINVGTLYDGYQAYSDVDYGVGTVNVSGPGTLTVSGTLYLAQTSGSTGAASTTGTLNITGGTVAAGSIVTGAGGAASTITIQDATLSVTNFAGSAPAPVAYFTAGDSVLQLGLTTGVTNLEVGTLSVNNTTNNTINILSLPPIYSYPAQIPLISYASYSPAGPTDFVLGSLPAGSSAYGGVSIVNNPTDNTIDLVITSGPISVSPQIIWSGADTATDINWSDALNWLQPGNQGAPLSSQAVLFYDTGGAAAPGTVDNIVTASTTVASLQYGNTNNYHTTLINPGVTLTISNNAADNLLFVGTGTDNGSTQNVTATITGTGATLNVVSTNIASEAQVQQGSSAAGSHAATLNLAGLDTFNLAAGRLLVAGNPGLAVNASNYLGGTLILAKTNSIRLSGTNAPVLNISDAESNGNTTTNALELGQANSIFADTITVGRSKCLGSLQFNPALGGGNPALYLRGQTAAAVSQLAIGDDSNIGETGYSSAGTVDLSLGTVNALVNTCYVGRGQNGTNTGTATGVLILGAGVFNVNTLNVGAVTVNSAIAASTGTVDVTAGGTLVINTDLALGLNPGATAAAIATLNITNGIVLASAINPGTGNVTSIINLAGGTLVVSNTVGSPSAPLGTLNLGGGSLQLSVNGAVAQTNLVATTVTVSSPTLVGLSTIGGVATGTAYPLISYTGADPYANLTLGAIPAGYSATLVDNAPAKLISVQFTSLPGELPPTINQVANVNGSLVFSGSNGVANGTYYVLTATNLTLPPANWTRVATNVFSGTGTFSVTNAINPAVGQEFYRIAQ